MTCCLVGLFYRKLQIVKIRPNGPFGGIFNVNVNVECDFLCYFQTHCSIVYFHQANFLQFYRRKKKCARLRPPGFRGLAEEDEDEDDEDCCIQDNKATPIQRVQPPDATVAPSVLHLTSNPLISSMYPNSPPSTITSPFLYHP